jgi:hypothetical protein
MTGNISPRGGPAVAVRLPTGGTSLGVNWLLCIQSGTKWPSARGPATGIFPALALTGRLGSIFFRYRGCLAAYNQMLTIGNQTRREKEGFVSDLFNIPFQVYPDKLDAKKSSKI